MSQGIRVVIYPVKDLAQAKALYSKLLGVEPYTDEAYYVGYWQVNDIQKSLQLLLDAGAQAQQGVQDVGGG